MVGVVVDGSEECVMSKEVKLCREDCIYLEPKEDEQTNKKEAHMCIYYKTKLYHRGRHPRIVAVCDYMCEKVSECQSI